MGGLIFNGMQIVSHQMIDREWMVERLAVAEHGEEALIDLFENHKETLRIP